MKTPTNNWYAITQKTDSEGTPLASAEIAIYDEIGGWGITANELIRDVKALGEIEEINLRINSPGGSIIEGNAIYNYLRRKSDEGVNIAVHIDGMAASMASVIAMAGDTIEMAANGFIMIHNPWTVSIGDSEKLRADADLMDKMKLNIINAYSRSNHNAEELADLMDKETWLTAKEALDSGFIDGIEGAIEAAASIKDLNEKLEKIECSIPVEKFMQSKIAIYESDIESMNAELTSATAQLAENAVKISDLQNKVQELNDCIDKMDTAHKAELEEANKATEEARKATEKAVAAKAAEIVGAQTQDPIPESEEGAAVQGKTLTEQYAELKTPRERDQFRKKHFAALQKELTTNNK